jgi:hypothetical protein
MTSIDDIRDRIRIDLHDTDSGAYRWSDDALDRHIEHALEEISLAIPQELRTTIATTPGSRDLDISSLDGLIAVERVEFPAGLTPVCFVPFTRWASTLTFDAGRDPAGEDAAIFYTARHVLDGDGSTLPLFLEDLVATGASAYAVLEQSVATVDTLNTGGQAPEVYAAWARARLIAFRQLLMQYGRDNRVRSRRLLPA